MKQIFTSVLSIALVTFSYVSSAQPNQEQSQRGGKPLVNKLKTNAQQFENRTELNLNRLNKERSGNNTQERGSRSNNNKRQQRNYFNMGASEIYLRMPYTYDYYTVIIGDQMVANDNGYYRFYEIMPGFQELLIYKNNWLIFAGNIQVNTAQRMFMDFYENEGVYFLGAQPLQHYYQSYNGQYWDQMWNGYTVPQHNYNNYPNNSNNPYYNQQPVYESVQVMDEMNFASFLQTLDNTPYSSSKMQLINTQSTMSYFTAQQISRIVGALTYDSDQFNAAKKLFATCVDRENYYMVVNKLQYDSSKNNLLIYMKNYRD